MTSTDTTDERWSNHSSLVNNAQQPPSIMPASRRFLRGPLLWLVGAMFMTLMLITLILFAVRSNFNVSRVLLLPWPLLLLVAISVVVLAVAVMIYFSLLTSASLMLFGLDCYHLWLRPRLVSLTRTASAGSLDDALVWLCDPTQLVAGLSSCLLLPVVLYTLPTTPEQRVRILQAVGLLPSSVSSEQITVTPNAMTAFTAPGGWKVLLPRRMQQFLYQVENPSTTVTATTGSCAPLPVLLHDGRAGTTNAIPEQPTDLVNDRSHVGDDEISSSDFDKHIGMDASMASSLTTNKVDPNAKLTCVPSRPSSVTTTTNNANNSANEEVYEILVTVLRDMVQQTIHHVCDMLRQHQTMSTTIAAVTTTIMSLHWRRCSHARAVGAAIGQALLLTMAGTTMTTSVAALLAPYYFEYCNKHRRQLRAQDVSATSTPAAARQSASLAVAAFLQSVRYSCTNPEVPRSVSVRTTESLTRLVKGVARWKGTIAVWVLAYFQYRRSRRRIQAGTK